MHAMCFATAHSMQGQQQFMISCVATWLAALLLPWPLGNNNNAQLPVHDPMGPGPDT